MGAIDTDKHVRVGHDIHGPDSISYDVEDEHGDRQIRGRHDDPQGPIEVRDSEAEVQDRPAGDAQQSPRDLLGAQDRPPGQGRVNPARRGRTRRS